MSELYERDKMSGHDYFRAELDVNPELPDFEEEISPEVRVDTPMGELTLTWDNTTMVRYNDPRWEHMDHIIVADQLDLSKCVYMFRNSGTYEGEEERFKEFANELMGHGFTPLDTYSRPNSLVLTMFWKGVRGEQTLDEVLSEILSETEQ